MLRAIGQLRKNVDIIITRPDKGSGVVLMDKSEYVRLLKEASINDETKFVDISLDRPNTKGRPPKHYHPLLRKEKELASIVRREKLKPISTNEHTIGDIFSFADDLQEMKISDHDILASYDAFALYRK